MGVCWSQCACVRSVHAWRAHARHVWHACSGNAAIDSASSSAACRAVWSGTTRFASPIFNASSAPFRRCLPPTACTTVYSARCPLHVVPPQSFCRARYSVRVGGPFACARAFACAFVRESAHAYVQSFPRCDYVCVCVVYINVRACLCGSVRACARVLSHRRHGP